MEEPPAAADHTALKDASSGRPISGGYVRSGDKWSPSYWHDFSNATKRLEEETTSGVG